MIKKVLVLTLLLLFFIYSDVFSFQFQDYQWGESVDEIMQRLNNKRKRFSYIDFALTYADKILGQPCEVFLAFSPKSKELAFVSISWDTTSVGEELKESLFRKYGEFYNVIENMYFWLGPKKVIADSIYLNYSSKRTRLIYFGGKYYEKYNEEKRE